MSDSKRHGETIFLTGPPLAGKTSTTMKWAAERSRPTAPLDWDEVHAVLFRGDRLREATDVHERYKFAAHTAVATAAHVTAEGSDCVITGARVPAKPTDPREWRGHWDTLDRLDPITIVLFPSLEVRLERLWRVAATRPGGEPHISEDYVRHTHDFGWERWYDHPRAFVLDNSDRTPADVVDAVEQAVTRLAGQSAASV